MKRRRSYDRTLLRPTLRFTPMAWAKLIYWRDAGPTEIGGFGLTSPDDLLCVEDIVLVDQVATTATVAFDDLAVAEFFERQIEAGRKPAEFARIWIHTHPGCSPTPSGVDEETFERVFGRCDWAVMAILAQGGASYARLAWHTGPGGEWRIPVEVDYAVPFAGTDHAAWQTEYERSVRPGRPTVFETLPQEWGLTADMSDLDPTTLLSLISGDLIL